MKPFKLYPPPKKEGLGVGEALLKGWLSDFFPSQFIIVND
jgi:hypothetical protein